MQSTWTTKFLAVLFLLVLGFSIWNWRHRSRGSDEVVERNMSIHDGGHKNSWIIDIDFDRKLVQILTIEGVRMDIVFEAGDEFLAFMKGNSKAGLLPVTFICGEKRDEECNLDEPYDLYVATRKVKPVIVQKNPGNSQ